MASYFWVGGFTGYKGMHSGYDATGNYWTNWQTGTTSTAGDLLFGPYSWGVTANWRINLEDVGGATTSYYLIPNELPQGGRDSVFFQKISGIDLSLSGQTYGQINPYNISCFYGGMSGDGFTASSSTGWVGNNGNERYQSIDIRVDSNWLPVGLSGGFDQGKIGKLGITANYPLRVYPGNTYLFEDVSYNTGSTIALQSMHSKSAVQNLHGGSVRLVPNLYMQPNGSYSEGSTVGRRLQVNLGGGWGYIYQNTGTLVLGQMFSAGYPAYSDGFGITFSNQVPNVLIRGDIRRFLAEEKSNVHYYMIQPKSALEGVEIKGRSMWPLSATHGPNVSIVRVSGWKTMSNPENGVNGISGGYAPGARPENGIILGKMPTNSGSTSGLPFYIEELHVDNYLNSFGGTFPANVWLANTEIRELKGIAGGIVPLTNYPNNFVNQVRIKNGYAMNGFKIYASDEYALSPYESQSLADGLVKMVVGITNTSGYAGAYSSGVTSNIGLTSIGGSVYGIRYDNVWPNVPSQGALSEDTFEWRFSPHFSNGTTGYIKTFNTSLTRPSGDPS